MFGGLLFAQFNPKLPPYTFIKLTIIILILVFHPICHTSLYLRSTYNGAKIVHETEISIREAKIPHYSPHKYFWQCHIVLTILTIYFFYKNPLNSPFNIVGHYFSTVYNSIPPIKATPPVFKLDLNFSTLISLTASFITFSADARNARSALNLVSHSKVIFT